MLWCGGAHQDKDESSNVVHVGDSFYFRGHLCIGFELLSLNLYEFVKNNNFQGLSLGLIRRFAQQLLVSLRYLRQHKIIHCDLKPENILLKGPNKSSIKVCSKPSLVHPPVSSIATPVLGTWSFSIG